MTVNTISTTQLTFTRFIAAILIVVYHFGDVFPPFSWEPVKKIIVSSSWGVSYFFTLSGFVMMVAYGQCDVIGLKGYMWRRLIRIGPVYYFAMAAMLLYYSLRIGVLGQESNYTPSLTDTIYHVFFIQAWFSEKALTINVAAWSLSVEFFFYLCFPFLFNQCYRKWPLRRSIYFAAGVFLASQMLFHFFKWRFPDSYSIVKYHPLLHLNTFVVGNVLGLTFLRYQKAMRDNSLLLIFIFLLSIVGVYLPYGNIDAHNGLYLVFFAPIIYLLAYDNSWIAKLFNRRPLIYLGEVSYSVYILQFPVYLFFTGALSFFGFKINQPLFYVFLVILIGISAATYELIEKPFRDKFRSSFRA